MPTLRKTDIAVIGADTAGITGFDAIRRPGAEALFIDYGPLGTTRAHVGCMPSQAALHAGQQWSAMARRHGARIRMMPSCKPGNCMCADAAATLQMLLHAPTLRALARARSNATNLLKETPRLQVRIVANDEAVAAALDESDPGSDAVTWLCPNTLRKLDRPARAPMQVLPKAAVLMLATFQRGGWAYIRA